MPRRSLLSDTERDRLLVFPESQDGLIQQYSFTDADMALIRQRRGSANRLGFAVQLCLLRYPGYALSSETVLPNPVIQWIANQVESDAAVWPEYGGREKTRNELCTSYVHTWDCPCSGCRTFANWCTAWLTLRCRSIRP